VEGETGRLAGVEKYQAGFLGGFGGDVQEEKLTKGKAVIEFSGAFEKNEESRNGYVDLSLNYKKEEGDVGSLALSVISLDKATYLKAGEINIPVGDDSKLMVDALISALNGKWIKLDKSSFDSLSSDVNVEEDEDSKKDSEKAEKIMELAEETQFFSVSKTIGVEKVKAGRAKHFVANLDKEETLKFSLEAYKINNDGEKMPADELESMENWVGQLDNKDIHLWIGVGNSLLYKVSFEGDIKDVEEGNQGKIKAVIELFDHNKKITLEEPESYSTIEELMGQVFGTMMFGQLGNLGSSGLQLSR